MADPARTRKLALIVLGAYLLNPVWAEMFFAPLGITDVMILFSGRWFETAWTAAASVGAVAAIVCTVGALIARRTGWVCAWMWCLAAVVSVHCWGMFFGLFDEGGKTYGVLNAVLTVVAVASAVMAGRSGRVRSAGDAPNAGA